MTQSQPTAPAAQPTASFEARVEAARSAFVEDVARQEVESGTSYSDWDAAMAAALRAADAITSPSPALPANVAALVERARTISDRLPTGDCQTGKYYTPEEDDARDDAAALVRDIAAIPLAATASEAEEPL